MKAGSTSQQRAFRLSRTMAAFAAAAVAMPAMCAQSYASGDSQDSSQACTHMDTVKIQEYAGLISNLVPWAAMAQGIFKKHCLDVKMLPIPSAPAAYAASVQGGVDFVSTAPETAYVPATQGMDVKFVAAMNDTVYYALVVRKDLPLPHKSEGYPGIMHDLVGKRVGVNQLGSTTDTLSRANFLAAGLKPDTANWIAYGSPAAGIAGLQSGSLDAAEFFGDGMDIAAAATSGTIVGDLRYADTRTLPLIAKMHGAGLQWAAQASFIKSHPDVVRRFVLANNEAVAWIRNPQHFDAVVKLVGEKTPSPEGMHDPHALLVERVKRYVPQVSSKLSLSALEAWNEWAVKMRRIPKPVDVKSMVWDGAKDMIVP